MVLAAPESHGGNNVGVTICRSDITSYRASLGPYAPAESRLRFMPLIARAETVLAFVRVSGQLLESEGEKDATAKRRWPKLSLRHNQGHARLAVSDVLLVALSRLADRYITPS